MQDKAYSDREDIVIVPIEDEMSRSYLDYAMSVITSRAIPDVRDGLKTVHRRIIYAMKVAGNLADKPFKKSARIVGDVVGKYHPHGNEAVYDAITRMAQEFVYRAPLISGQGNFGSIDGDSPAAMRYTAVRLSPIGSTLVEDLDKDTVDFVANYDDTETIPEVLPARIPNLLLNGTSGIAVGVATSIPPHNINELVDALLLLLYNPKASLEELLQYIKGPDFPTGGIIFTDNINSIYDLGRGSITIRAKTEIKATKQEICITELPYQVAKSELLSQLAELVNSSAIEGISNIVDESDKKGVKITISLKKNIIPEVVLNNLFKLSKLESQFHCNFIALDMGNPKLLSLGQILRLFLDHRMSVVTKRVLYLLNKAKNRLLIVQGLLAATDNITQIVDNIKKSESYQLAKEYLLTNKFSITSAFDSLSEIEKLTVDEDFKRLDGNYYTFSELQANHVLDMRLQTLTGFERDKIEKDSKSLLNEVATLEKLLSSREERIEVIKNELLEVQKQFSSSRLTGIHNTPVSFKQEDFINPEPIVISLSETGYIKSQKLESYDLQHRAGKGKRMTTLKDEDVVKIVTTISKRDTLLCCATSGYVFWLKVYSIGQDERSSKGKPVSNFLPLDSDEKITALVALENKQDLFIVFVTQRGTVKKCQLEYFIKPRYSGLKAIKVRPGDSVVSAFIAKNADDIMIFSNSSKVVRFSCNSIRLMGRNTIGIRGIKLSNDEEIVINAFAISNMFANAKILSVTQNGYGKLTSISQFRKTARSAKGVKSIVTSKRNGKIVMGNIASDNDDLLLVTHNGIMERISVSSISTLKRMTQGVKLIDLSKDDYVATAGVIPEHIHTMHM